MIKQNVHKHIYMRRYRNIHTCRLMRNVYSHREMFKCHQLSLNKRLSDNSSYEHKRQVEDCCLVSLLFTTISSTRILLFLQTFAYLIVKVSVSYVPSFSLLHIFILITLCNAFMNAKCLTFPSNSTGYFTAFCN